MVSDPDLILLDFVPHLERLECRAHQLRLVLNDSSIAQGWKPGSPLVAGPRWGCRAQPDASLFDNDPRRRAPDSKGGGESGPRGHVYRRLVRTWVRSPTKVVLDTLPMEWWEAFEDAVISVRAFSPDFAVARHHRAPDAGVEELRRRHRAASSRILPHLDSAHALRGHVDPVHHRYAPHQKPAPSPRPGPTRRRVLAAGDNAGSADAAGPWAFEHLGDAAGLLHRAKLPRSADKKWLMAEQLEQEMGEAEREDRRRLAQRMSRQIEEMVDRLAAAGSADAGNRARGGKGVPPRQGGPGPEPRPDADPHGSEDVDTNERVPGQGGEAGEGEGKGTGRWWHRWRRFGASEEDLHREEEQPAWRQRLRFRSQLGTYEGRSEPVTGSKTVERGWNVKEEKKLELENPSVDKDEFHYFEFKGEAKPTDADRSMAVCDGDLTLWGKEKKKIKTTVPVPSWLNKALGEGMSFDADFRCEKCFAVMGAEFDMTVVKKNDELESVTAILTEGIGINLHNVIETKVPTELAARRPPAQPRALPTFPVSAVCPQHQTGAEAVQQVAHAGGYDLVCHRANELWHCIPGTPSPPPSIHSRGVLQAAATATTVPSRLTHRRRALRTARAQVKFEFQINMMFALEGKMGFGFKTSAERTRKIELKRDDGFHFKALPPNDTKPEFTPIYEPPSAQVEAQVQLVPSIDLRLLLMLEQIPFTDYGALAARGLLVRRWLSAHEFSRRQRSWT